MFEVTSLLSLAATTQSRQNENEGEEKRTGEISLKPAFKTLTLRVLAIIIYMCLGALVFCAIEYRDQDKTLWRRKTHIMRLSFMSKYNITDQELKDYENAVIHMRIEQRASHHEWSYYQSLYFVSTVTTTIGELQQKSTHKNLHSGPPIGRGRGGSLPQGLRIQGPHQLIKNFYL